MGSRRVRDPLWRERDEMERTRSNRQQGCAVDQRRFGRSFDHSDLLRGLIKEELDSRFLQVMKRRTRLVFRVEHCSSTRDDVLSRTAVTKLTAFAAAHRIDYLC